MRYLLFFLVAIVAEINAQIHENSTAAASAMFIMGDSSVDCGDNSPFYPILHPRLSLIVCKDSEPSLLPHLLAEKMGVPKPRPFYARKWSSDEFQKGLNYGSSDATIMNIDSQIHQSLNKQLRQALETLQLMQLQFDDERAREFLSSSIFYLSFGKNDYIDIFLRNFSGMQLKYTAREFARILVNQMGQVLQNLYTWGVRKVICIGILPLGCAPRVILERQDMTMVPRDVNGCSADINSIISEYNSMLEKHIKELNANQTSFVTFCDVFEGMTAILANPEQYGFNDSRTACCGLGMFGAAVGCLDPTMACTQSSKHVWWDLYNPTRALNMILADSAWSGNLLPSICRPMMIQTLVSIKSL